LAEIFSASQLLADAALVVWQALPMLSRGSCDRLAARLIAARDSEPTSSEAEQMSLLDA
jgi:hypothetical protein